MINTVRKTRQKLADTDLNALENRLGTPLPDAYRTFLLQYNGGEPEPNYYRTEDGHQARVRTFFHLPVPGEPAVGQKRDLDDLYRILDVYQGARKRVTPDVLPIARDEGGNLICLGITGEYRGAVCFWDHEQEYDEDEDAPDDYSDFGDDSEEYTPPPAPEVPLRRIQKSFEAFLDSFHEDGTDPLEERFKAFYFQVDRFAEVEAVLDAGFSPDYVLPIYNMTALEFSALYRQPEKVEILLRKGARKNIENALLLAEQRGNKQCAEIIRHYLTTSSAP